MCLDLGHPRTTAPSSSFVILSSFILLNHATDLTEDGSVPRLLSSLASQPVHIRGSALVDPLSLTRDIVERSEHQPGHALLVIAAPPENSPEGPHRAHRRIVELPVEPVRLIEELRVDQLRAPLGRVRVLVKGRHPLVVRVVPDLAGRTPLTSPSTRSWKHTRRSGMCSTWVLPSASNCAWAARGRHEPTRF